MARQSEARAKNDYNTPDSYANLDELADAVPIENPNSKSETRHQNDLEEARQNEKEHERNSNGPDSDNAGINHGDKSDEYMNLDELAAPSPVENPEERHFYRHHDLEEERTQEETFERRKANEGRSGNKSECEAETRQKQRLTQLYVTSYLILFAILGTLARLGITALTTYPGAPIIITEVWANVGGCFIMGWLSEDRFLFRREWSAAQNKARSAKRSEENGSENEKCNDDEVFATAKKEHDAVKKTVPLFIGLAVGFCGSFTSFSSFIRDTFLALDNGLATLTYSASGSEVGEIYSRSAGYSVMSVLAVVILEVSLCMFSLHVGADFAIAIEPFVTSIPTANLRRFVDPLAVLVAWGAWIGSIIMAIWPPDRLGGPAASGQTIWAAEIWRGQAIFALVFAPIGCLLRFHASLRLNGKLSTFPLGTFVVNIFGTMIIGMAWDLQRAPLDSGLIGGGRLGCQVLQGIEDGFCGCLTTVSTWVLELKGLQRKHAYIYGASSIVLGLCFLMAIMGSLVWTTGPSPAACKT